MFYKHSRMVLPVSVLKILFNYVNHVMTSMYLKFYRFYQFFLSVKWMILIGFICRCLCDENLCFLKSL